jgi:hypothetical protein
VCRHCGEAEAPEARSGGGGGAAAGGKGGEGDWGEAHTEEMHHERTATGRGGREGGGLNPEHQTQP